MPSHLAAMLAADEKAGLQIETKRIFREFIQPAQLVGDVYAISYETALVQIHDRFRQLVGGIPSLCLLLATRVDPEAVADFEQEDASLILLRVLDAAPLPNEMEAERVRVEAAQRVAGETGVNWDDQAAMDAVTANLLSYAGVRCRVLGTFYLGKKIGAVEPTLELRFGSDISNFYPNRGLKVFKPNARALEQIVNYRDPLRLSSSIAAGESRIGEKSLGSEDGGPAEQAVVIGEVRYASTSRDFQGTAGAAAAVSLLPEDLLGQKTALFGMTRSGKSNTTKIIAKAVFEMRYAEPTTRGRRIGQLIFDPNGEYANENTQDGAGKRSAAAIKNLRDARPGALKSDVVTYGIAPHPADPERRLMLLNFFLEANLQTGKNIIDYALEGDASKFIRNFQQVAFELPEAAAVSAAVRHQRHVLCYRALLAKAGFAPPAKLQPEIKRLFNKGLLNAMAESTGARAADHAQAARLLAGKTVSWSQMAAICESLYDFMVDRASGYALFEADYAARSSSGEAWADDNLKKILEMFRYPNGSRQIGKVLAQHTPHTAGDYAAEIYQDLAAGKLVIVDQSAGDEEINRANATRLMSYIFRRNQEAFRRAVQPPDILIYVEEAHNILPAGSETDLQDIWVRTAKEGGKYRLGLVYATQEVSSIQRNIVKNTANFFVAHLNNTDETRELCKYYDFADFEASIRRAQDKGFLRIKTLSNMFVVPAQIKKFEV